MLNQIDIKQYLLDPISFFNREVLLCQRCKTCLKEKRLVLPLSRNTSDKIQYLFIDTEPFDCISNYLESTLRELKIFDYCAFTSVIKGCVNHKTIPWKMSKKCISTFLSQEINGNLFRNIKKIFIFNAVAYGLMEKYSKEVFHTTLLKYNSVVKIDYSQFDKKETAIKRWSKWKKIIAENR